MSPPTKPADPSTVEPTSLASSPIASATLGRARDTNGRATVLLVDDRPENLMALEAVLEPLQLNLVAVESGQEALRELLERDFAVILLDVQMPGLDGFETAALIKGRDRTRHVPIIFLTAHETDSSRVFRGYEVGAVDYLRKPFDPTILRSKVRVFVELFEKTNALEAARLERRHADQLKGLAEASVSVAGARSFDQALRLSEHWARQIVGVERSFATLFDGGPAVTGRPATGDRRPRRAAGDLAGAELSAPLTAPDGRQLGLIQLAGKLDGGFNEGDQAILTQLAQMASAAIEGVRLYEHEHNIAQALQRSLLPERLPEVAGVAMGAAYEPAGPGLAVGGDWYDVIPLEGGRVGLALGDVTGRGLPAATVMGQLRTALRAYALEGHPPADVIDRLDMLVAALEVGHMTTVVYAVIDPGTAALRFACAGHPPPLLVSPEGGAAFLEGGRSLPLGVMADRREEAEVPFEAGAMLLLDTDGLVESRAAALPERLEELRSLAAAGPGEPGALCDHVLQELRDGDADDVAVLAVRAVAPGHRFAISLPSAPESLGPLRERLRTWLEEAGATTGEVFEITAAVGEACTNAVEHPQAAGEDPLQLQATLVDRELSVTVRDSGQWRAPRAGNRGRGLPLMEVLMESVDIRPGPTGTEVRLRRRLADGA